MTSFTHDSVPPYWYDGQLLNENTLTLSLQDPGWLYGATVFTTLRVYEHDLAHPWTAWQDHVARIEQSLRDFDWVSPQWVQVQQGAEQLAQVYPVLRITLFPDGRVLIMGRSLPAQLSSLQTQGITAWVANSPNYCRSLPGHKTGNYLGCWLARQAAQQVGAQEAILTNSQGCWLETSTGNLWGWSTNAWWTPPLTAGILPGVLRSRLVQGLQAQGHRVEEQMWTPAQTTQFTCLAYTNSVLEVIPIQTVLRSATSVNYNPDHSRIQQLNAAWRSVC